MEAQAVWVVELYADQVQKIVTICEEDGFVRPSIYQGQYSAIVRSREKELFPCLRKPNLAICAWRSAAADTFAGNHRVDQIGGRYDFLVSAVSQPGVFLPEMLTQFLPRLPWVSYTQAGQQIPVWTPPPEITRPSRLSMA